MREIDSFRGFKIYDEHLQHWATVLEEWLLLNERFSRIKGGGASAFGYGERANVSLLAGAAWRSGYIAITEFAHLKESGGDSQKGRADLEISTPDCTDVIEAKFRWVELSSKRRRDKIREVMVEARVDALRSQKPDQYRHAIGMAFVGTYIKGKRKAHMDDLILQTIRQICEEDFAMVAWSFPSEERKEPTLEGNYTPGVILTARLAAA